MQWDDLRYLLALMRGGSLAQAARALNVDKTTVARRLASLEGVLGEPIVERGAAGQVRLAEAGRRVARRAEAMEDAARQIQADFGAQPGALAGRVRLSVVPLLAHRVLVPQVSALVQAAPGLGLELLAESRDVDLLERDADMALRLARPRRGGRGVVARKLGQLEYRCYASRSTAGEMPWIGYEPAMQHLEIAQIIEALAGRCGARRADLSFNDAEGVLCALRLGLGQSLLPRIVGDRQPDLRRVEVSDARLPSREIWRLTRRDLAGLDRIRAVHTWLDRVFSAV